jgi:hypothetical protein
MSVLWHITMLAYWQCIPEVAGQSTPLTAHRRAGCPATVQVLRPVKTDAAGAWDSVLRLWPPGAVLRRSGHPVLQSIDALAEALQQFEGGVVIISHDAQLLSRVCDETSEVRRTASSAPASN